MRKLTKIIMLIMMIGLVSAGIIANIDRSVSYSANLDSWDVRDYDAPDGRIRRLYDENGFIGETKVKEQVRVWNPRTKQIDVTIRTESEMIALLNDWEDDYMKTYQPSTDEVAIEEPIAEGRTTRG